MSWIQVLSDNAKAVAFAARSPQPRTLAAAGWGTLLSVVLAVGELSAAQADGAKRDIRCGSYCLYVALGALGTAPEGFDSLERLLGAPHADGYSMSQLSEAAQKLGAHTIAVETTLENLHARTEPLMCIALMKGSHFVLLYDSDQVDAFLIDPPRSYTVPIDTFKQEWTGKALLIGLKQFEAEESVVRQHTWRVPLLVGALAILAATALYVGTIIHKRLAGRKWAQCLFLVVFEGIVLHSHLGCRGKQSVITDQPRSTTSAGASIQLDPDFRDLGDIVRGSPGETLEVTTGLRNVGTGVLQIKSVLLSCPCVKASVDNSEMKPGERAVLTTLLDPGDSSEPRSAQVIIESNDPGHPRSAVQFAWRAVNPLATHPRDFDFGQMRPGESRIIESEIRSNGLALCRQCGLFAETASPLVHPAVVAADGHDLPTEHTRAEPTLTRTLGSLRVGVNAGVDPTRARDYILLRVRCRTEERGRLAIPVTWSVAPIVSIAPSRLSFGLSRPGDPVRGRCVIRSVQQSAFRVLKVECRWTDGLCKTNYAVSPSPTHTLDITATPSKEPGPWRASLLIQTDHPGAESLELPVSGFVEGDRP
jgi:Peptidase C39 family/Protein of unknown function (DUF1573)